MTVRFLAMLVLAVMVAAPTPGLASSGALDCDFNGDGFADLAIGEPFKDVGADGDEGAVGVVYGTGGNLSTSPTDFWTQSSAGIKGVAEVGDGFGWVVECGDFDGDGFADLAIGIPNDEPEVTGSVAILYGSAGGLTDDDQLWTLNSVGVQGTASSGDGFGWALAVGDFDDDGFDDLAIGVPFDSVSSMAAAGAVNVLPGSPGGLTATGDLRLHQDLAGIQGTPVVDDQFGRSLASGDFNNDGFDDLAVGALRNSSGHGEVSVVLGGAAGLGTTDQLWTQDVTGVPGTAEANDLFGANLAAGDVNGDNRDDLAIAVPGEDSNEGAVLLMRGAAAGLTTTGAQVWHQDTTGVQGVGAAGDRLGAGLELGDVDEDGFADLVMGAPGDSAVTTSAGSVNLIPGSPSGLTATGDEFWNQDSTGVQGIAESDDLFGLSLRLLDLNGDGKLDLAIGAPGENVGSVGAAGQVNLLLGATSGLTASGDLVITEDRVNGEVEADAEFGRVAPNG